MFDYIQSRRNAETDTLTLSILQKFGNYKNKKKAVSKILNRSTQTYCQIENNKVEKFLQEIFLEKPHIQQNTPGTLYTTRRNSVQIKQDDEHGTGERQHKILTTQVSRSRKHNTHKNIQQMHPEEENTVNMGQLQNSPDIQKKK